MEAITQKENEEYGDKDLREMGEGLSITSEEIKELAKKVNAKLDEINDREDAESKDVKKN